MESLTAECIVAGVRTLIRMLAVVGIKECFTLEALWSGGEQKLAELFTGLNGSNVLFFLLCLPYYIHPTRIGTTTTSDHSTWQIQRSTPLVAIRIKLKMLNSVLGEEHSASALQWSYTSHASETI